MSTLNWVAVDWGSSHLRVWGMAGPQVLHRARSDQGAASLAPDGFEPALMALVAGWLRAGQVTPVLACGMVGARQGWVEAGYRAVPCTPLGGVLTPVPVRDPRVSVHLVPGLKQPRPADVMLGEETQIAGFLAQHPDWEGVVCLPGTHSKWSQLRGGEVISFQTCLTGEMFALLSQHSVLRHGIAGWEEAGFTEGLDQGFEHPERLLAQLFAIRAEGLLAGLDPGHARARLSGLLIGTELAAARPGWLGRRVAVLGEGALAGLYAQALARLSVPVSTHDTAALTLAGLASAYHANEQGPSDA